MFSSSYLSNTNLGKIKVGDIEQNYTSRWLKTVNCPTTDVIVLPQLSSVLIVVVFIKTADWWTGLRQPVIDSKEIDR